jgi:hypothetical protein
VKHRPTTIRDRLGALRGLLRISDDDYNAYMRSYGELFVDSPENTKADYDNSVPLRGYPLGSSTELTELYKVIHLLCTLGSVEKMYMPPQIDPTESVLANQILFERIVADSSSTTSPPWMPTTAGKTNALMGRMNENSHSYIRAEQEELLTLNWHCVGEKPGAAT